jgi:protein-L-isoaspartate(D-aspartate) O-methyltransferase
MRLPPAPGTATSAISAHELVDAAQLAGVDDERVLGAIAVVPRAGFVPGGLSGQAHLDRPLPIPHGQVTTQPSLVAAMLEALDLDGTEDVLEIGTGYGWQAALLARLGRFVWTMERLPDLAEAAAAALVRQGIENVRVLVGDGTRGLPARAPFHAIIVSAAFPRVPEPIARQLIAGGRVIQPMGEGGAEEVVLFEKGADGALERKRTVIGAHFVRLYGRHGFPPES